ncbi:MAG: 3',5'-nucleoside bisphosphate phosphatase [candidate division WS2 bacterium]|nr:3',5'-nucleoside bisphosphate phosphatase [Candidatus Lithacetigena glycinireducens]MBT9175209.1 3',5'-nucleoside bisphosphate phosphatase [Candidatus Lithacetigena glycinireducens]
MPRVGDLHLHSFYSDGEQSIDSLINLSCSVGLSFISITDHDTLDHLDDESMLPSNKIEIIEGVEISTLDNEVEYHIIGYFLSNKNETLKNLIQDVSCSRDERIRQMVENLNKKGLEVAFDEVKRKAKKGFLARNHIAEILLDRGYTKSIPEAFTDDFISKNSESYVERVPIPPDKVINIIRSAGGVAVLAHPGNTPGIIGGVGIKELTMLKELGLQGLEVFQPKHSSEDIKRYLKQANKLGLIITGGTDYHGKYSPDIQLGMVRLPEKYLETLKKLKQ